MGTSRRRWRVVRDSVAVLLVAVLVSVGIKAFLLRSFSIPSASMEATLQVGDRVLVNELVPKLTPVARGDVIVFEDPGGWLPPKPAGPSASWVGDAIHWVGVTTGLVANDADDYLIKRVIGLPGDEVKCCTPFGQLTVNGKPVVEPYLPDAVSASATPFAVTVPQRSLWVMGDNRDASADSRAHMGGPGNGFVPYSRVVGRAFAVTWPVTRWAWLGNYPDAFAGR